MARASKPVRLYRVDVVFVGPDACETRVVHALFSEGRVYFTECGKSRWPRWRIPKTAAGGPDRGWAFTVEDAWIKAIDASKDRRADLKTQIALEDDRTHALLCGLGRLVKIREADHA